MWSGGVLPTIIARLCGLRLPSVHLPQNPSILFPIHPSFLKPLLPATAQPPPLPRPSRFEPDFSPRPKKSAQWASGYRAAS
ncbi:hypothetical protein CGRA01v4_11946 [Colletotrichum graminicola]|nr:hypothetical protein CGRA01v4_11946 [Colletotrichum graminicola]